MRWAGLRVINLGSTAEARSFGKGLEERKLFLGEGTDDEELKSFL